MRRMGGGGNLNVFEATVRRLGVKTLVLGIGQNQKVSSY